MKKLLLLAIAAVATGTIAFAEPGKKLNYKGNSHFVSTYTDAKEVSWKYEGSFEKASFMLDGIQTNVFYTRQGELIGTSKTFAFDKLPKAALTNITTKYPYPAYQLQDCIEFVNAEGEKNYYVSMDQGAEKLVLEITKSGVVGIFSREKK